jgi:cytochrome P450
MTMIEYDPFSAEAMQDPQPIYRRLRDEAPAYYLPKYDAWALSRFADIWDRSSDPAFSAARGTTPSHVLTRTQPVTPMLNLMDPPEHTELRRAVRPRFSRAAIRDMEPVIRKLVKEALAKALPRGGCDVIGDVAAEVSVRVACLAIGIPLQDGDRLNELVWRFFAREHGVAGMTADGLRAARELIEYFERLVDARRRAGTSTNDVIDMFRQFELNGRRFSDAEIASQLSMLIIGGSETFPKTFANGVYRLWQHPDQRARLVREPDRIPDAYEEILRFDMPTQFLCRTLVKDVSLHGQTLRTGQGVMFLYASANHDEREFENPDVFDIDRKPTRILSFGAGTHACLGLHVAKMEGKVCFEELLAAAPEYEVDEGSASRLRTEFVQGFEKLPIRFTP